METFSREVENRPTLLVPIGDIQLGTEGCRWEDFKEWFADVLKMQKDYQLLFCGMGDFIDALRPTERGLYPRSSEHIKTSLEDKVEFDTEQLMEILEATTGKWLFTLRGHHFYEYPDGTTSDSRIADRLVCPFGGDTIYGTINFKGGGQYTIFARHGLGAASSTASAITRVRNQMNSNTADLNLRGHHHRTGVEKITTMSLSGRQKVKVSQHDRHGVLTGGWLNGYIEGRVEDGLPTGGYAERAGLNPIPTGGVKVWINPQSKGLAIEVTM
tara:strand:+ start:731 stop:1543 length:813 start_codon:yes stop_codon:yes gene_type:complete